ncbi:MAG: pancreas/duodenum homeobox protein 1 [Proteobacteria bacterium]|nr:pancreas/duodenum homeobox protein 1 [Pseudomonadota bacterium]
MNNFMSVFTPGVLEQLFPKERTDDFFEALFGDKEDGAYDISLEYNKNENNKLYFNLVLKQREGKCLVCSLTYGLPEVFSRHPIINLNGLMKDINQKLDGQIVCNNWSLGPTKMLDNNIHEISLELSY